MSKYDIVYILKWRLCERTDQWFGLLVEQAMVYKTVYTVFAFTLGK